jgi:hypothetical protein
MVHLLLCFAKLCWDYLLKPSVALIISNVEIVCCAFMVCFCIAIVVVSVECIMSTINTTQWMIRSFIHDTEFLIIDPIFWIYDAASWVYDVVYDTVYDFFIIEEHHKQIISVYKTVLQIITCPLWNITGFLIKKMMDASASATDDSIPDLAPSSPPSSPERSGTSEYPHHHDDWFDPGEFRARQQQKQSKDNRRNAYKEEAEQQQQPSPPVVDDDYEFDIDKFVESIQKNKSKNNRYNAYDEQQQQQQQQQQQPKVAVPIPATAPVRAPIPVQAPAPKRAICAVIKRRTFVNPIPGTTVKLSTKRSANEENHDEECNEMDRSRSRCRMKMGTDVDNFKDLAASAFPTGWLLKKKSRPFNNNEQDDPDLAIITSKLAAMRVTCTRKKYEMIIVEIVADGEDYTYMCPQNNIDEAQKIDLFDTFHDKEAIWNYIETVWCYNDDVDL